MIILNEMDVVKRVAKPSGAAGAFKFGTITNLGVEATVSISAAGIIQAPPGADAQSETDLGIINFHPMRLVSMAAGGENEYYEFVCYVAKDKDTKVRECHVFDCGDFADEVLATLGQAFVLAADLKSQKKKPAPKPAPAMSAVSEGDLYGGDTVYDSAQALPVIDEAFAVPADVQESLYDIANTAADAGKAPTQAELEPVYDAAVAGSTADDIAAELMGLMTSDAQCIYDTVQGNAPPSRPAAGMDGLVDKLNESDKVANQSQDLKGAPVKQEVRPSWVYFKESETLKKINHDELKKNFQIYGSGN